MYNEPHGQSYTNSEIKNCRYNITLPILSTEEVLENKIGT